MAQQLMTRSAMPEPRQLSAELRLRRSPELRMRRAVAGLALIGAAAGGIVGLYQIGLLRRLPDLPHPLFNATKVDKSDYAYKRLQTPDGFLMLASYAVTAILASAGGEGRSRYMPAVPLALAAKVLYDSGLAVKLGVEEWRENRALCGYCQAATLASLLSVALVLPEARQAYAELRPQAAQDRRRPKSRSAQRRARRG